MKSKYVYVPCDGGSSVNEKYRHYFRLYEVTENKKYILLEQGLSDLIPEWERYYGALMQVENPYPELD